LDLDMVSAACGQCHILLVEANAATTEAEFIAAMLASEEQAFSHETYGEKTTEISNSWGVWEFSGETSDDSYFKHPITITFASGDFRYTGRLRWPGSSQYVISTGATKLTKVEKPKESERAWTEEPWRTYETEGKRREGDYVGEHGAGTTSGCSTYETKPEWQKDKEGCARRTDVDVATVGASESLVSVYDTYEIPKEKWWEPNGGTSAAAPFVAGVEALSTPHSRNLGAQAFYIAGENKTLYDITKGGNGECGDLTGEKFTKCNTEHGYESSVECGAPETLHYYLCHALVGYDGPTGWGAPDGPPRQRACRDHGSGHKHNENRSYAERHC
jgi:subtilase family serine protease